jgi:hypothetical protein
VPRPAAWIRVVSLPFVVGVNRRVQCISVTPIRSKRYPLSSQITFQEIAEFIVKLRTPCGQAYGMGVRSLHGQWDKLIRDIWDIGNPDSQLSEAQKIEAILVPLAD